MPRKKPFSGKQKKAQLQAKRERRKEDGDEEEKVAADLKKVVFINKLNHQPISENGARDINRYKLHFSHESKVEVEQRKAESRKPLRMLSQRCLEVAIEDIFSEDKVIDIPKRPKWDYSMSKDEVEANEQKAFDEWVLAVHEKYGENVSHFEHNIETWRQLWRVLEISDIILLLSDIRHPVLHFPPALYRYVVEEMNKDLVFVLNKTDMVTPSTVDAWRDYFQEKFPKLHIACFTSYPHDQPTDIEQVFRKKRGRTKKSRMMARGTDQVLAACEACMVEKHGETFKFADWRARMPKPAGEEGDGETAQADDPEYESDSDEDGDVEAPELGVLADDEAAPHSDYVTIGVVGNPNVGKSSLLNGLVGKKVVSTSRTPGHTKHFQTIFLTPNVRLCDSPGLVFPSCVPKQLQVLSGIYPVAQVREPFTAIGYLAERVPLVQMLKLEWPYAADEHDGPIEWSAWTICDAWAKKRGYVTAKAARLDTYRAANSLLRLAVDGRIVLSIKPPGYFDRLDAEKEAAVALGETWNRDGEDDEDDEHTGSDSDDGHEPGHLHMSANPFAMLGADD